MSEKSWQRVKFMSALSEAQFLIRRLGGGDDVKPQLGIRSAYEKILHWCGSNKQPAFSRNRVRDCWYAHRRISVSGDELEILRAVARNKNEEAARVQLRSTIETLSILVNRLAAVDPDFHSVAIDAFSRALGLERDRQSQHGEEDRTMD